MVEAIFISGFIGLLWLIANFSLAAKFKKLAHNKGHDIDNYWFLWLFANLFLYLYIMALPTLTNIEHEDELPQMDELPQI